MTPGVLTLVMWYVRALASWVGSFMEVSQPGLYTPHAVLWKPASGTG